MQHVKNYFPTYCILIFAVLYSAAIILYPGGSQFDKTTSYFSLAHNYWCDLFTTTAYNGASNPSKPIAISAMVVICAGMSVLWWRLPQIFVEAKTYHRFIQYSGAIAMSIAVFLFTDYHDSVINVGGTIGALGLLVFLFGLYESTQYRLLVLGGICIVLSGINYIVYITGYGLFYLPIIQKITFLLFFIWAIALNWRLNKYKN